MHRMETFSVSTVCFLLLATISSISETEAFPTGPPVSINSVCSDMTPHHNNTLPESGIPPYSLTFSAQCYTPGQPITVTLSGMPAGNDTQTFTGFLIEARQNGVNTASYGQFTPVSDGVQALRCFGQANNAVGHSNPGADDWTTKQFNWTSSATQRGTIQFVATVVTDFEDFYVGWINNLTCCTNSTPITSTPTIVSTTGSATLIVHSLFTILTSGIAAVLAGQRLRLMLFS